MPPFLRILFGTFVGFLTLSLVLAKEIHVMPTGNDSSPGTAQQPIRSLSKAQEMARRSQDAHTTVYLHPGRWFLESPLTFDHRDSNQTWQAGVTDTVILSGGVVLTNWSETPEGLWKTTVPEKIQSAGEIRELFFDHERQTRARTPNEGYYRIEKAMEDKRSGFTFAQGDLTPVDDLDEVEMVFLHDWSITRVGVASIDPEERLLKTTHPIGANARHYAIDWFEPHPRYYLENSLQYLDRPGEWVYQSESGTLYYKPREGQTLNRDFVVPLATRLLEVNGTQDQPVQNLHFKGLRFAFCNWQIPANGYAEGQANYHEPRTDESGILREIIPAALQFKWAQRCSIQNTKVAHLGGGGIWIGAGSRDCLVKDCEVFDVSGNGILVGEDRGRLVQENPWWQQVPDQAATGNRVEDCRIHDCGRQFFGAVGIWVGLTQKTQILRNEIFNLPYTGVSLGWMWNPTPTPNGNNRVAYNHIHHIMQILSDGGGIYTLGRQPGTVLEHNTIHDIAINLGRAESNGMFLDEGTTEIVVRNNTIYNLDRAPLRFHRAGENLVKDNLLVVRDDVPHIRFNNTPEENIHQSGNVIAKEFQVQQE